MTISADTQSNYIFEGTAENFQSMVVSNSERGPVLLNFWSAKAGPCLRQYPILDKLVHEMDGRFLLINVDADAERALAIEHGVNSLPTLKLMRDREIIETLHGFQSEMDLRRTLSKYVARDSDQRIAQALEIYASGDVEKALIELAEASIDDGSNLKIPEVMTKILIREGRFDEAEKILKTLPSEVRALDEFRGLIAQVNYLLLAQRMPSVETSLEAISVNPDNLEARFQLAVVSISQGNMETALREFLEILTRDPDFREGIGQAGMLSVFRILKNRGELVEKYREAMREFIR